MNHVNRTLAVFAVAGLVLWLTGGLHGAPAIRITPANPTIGMGETVQFVADGGVMPAAASAGGWHTCVLLSDQSLRCTGRNNFGQLGDGTLNDSSESVAVSGITGASGISGGFEHTCALIGDGTMRCWGTNYTGQLGDGTMGGYSTVPVTVQGLTGAIQAIAGGFHSCAIRSDRTVRCWGRNADGQVGNGTTADVPLPASVVGLGSVAALSAGGYHTCALMSGGTIRCWGRNDDGQLGDGTGRSSATPVQVSGISGALAVAAGGYHTCALLSNGTVQCWGRNNVGQIGAPASTAFSYAPIPVSGISGVVDLVAGGYHGCAVLADRTMRCWGMNDYGQLGNGTTATSPAPVRVTGIADPALVTLGAWHSCVLQPDLSIRCWGLNDYGQLGNRSTSNALTAVKMNRTGVTWTTSDSTVATIDANGLARGVGGGSTTIGVTDSDGSTASTVLTVTANQPSFTLSVVRQGNGSGTVTSSPDGINCGTNCSATYMSGTHVTLTAVPAAGAVLSGWTGCDAVSGASCSVSMSATRTVQATFTQAGHALSVVPQGDGSGTVRSSPDGIDCGSVCSATYASETQVTLTATSAAGSSFSGWIGCDTVSGATCSVRMIAARTVQATFTRERFTLTVSKSGLGKGTVTSSPSGISCGTTCSGSFVSGATVTLTASPDLLSLFTGWSGCDATSGATCTVNMRSARSVTASFTGVPLF